MHIAQAVIQTWLNLTSLIEMIIHRHEFLIQASSSSIGLERLNSCISIYIVFHSGSLPLSDI